MDSDTGRIDGHGSDSGACAALCRSQAVVEFDLSGTILWANDLFLALSGYALEEIVAPAMVSTSLRSVSGSAAIAMNCSLKASSPTRLPRPCVS